jgi:hypothetical protein
MAFSPRASANCRATSDEESSEKEVGCSRYFAARRVGESEFLSGVAATSVHGARGGNGNP